MALANGFRDSWTLEHAPELKNLHGNGLYQQLMDEIAKVPSQAQWLTPSGDCVRALGSPLVGNTPIAPLTLLLQSRLDRAEEWSLLWLQTLVPPN